MSRVLLDIASDEAVLILVAFTALVMRSQDDKDPLTFANKERMARMTNLIIAQHGDKLRKHEGVDNLLRVLEEHE